MVNVVEIFKDFDELYALVNEKGRQCYHLINDDIIDKYKEKYPVWGKFVPCSEKGKPERFIEVSETEQLENLTKILEAEGYKILDMPHIEDVSESLRFLYFELTRSENNMIFVYEDDLDYYLDALNLSSQEEFEEQIDSDVKKYGIEYYLTKEEEEGVLYTLYGELQSQFTYEAK